jgi:molecular chaperone IbpA
MGSAGAIRACTTQRPGPCGGSLNIAFEENVMMFDYTPLYRSSVGFDRLFRLLDEAQNVETQSYPPYNIEKLGDNAYRISMAVAGFAQHEISIEAKGNSLTVTGKKDTKPEAVTEFLHQGIAARGFERRFQLADYMIVQGADLDHGLLHISLVREVPEAMKPRQIQINASNKQKVIDAKAA